MRRVLSMATVVVLLATIASLPVSVSAQSPVPSSPAVTPAPIPGAPLAGTLPDVQPSVRTWSWCAYHRFYPVQPIPPDVICDGVSIEQPKVVPVSPGPAASPDPLAPASPVPSPSAAASPAAVAAEPTDLPPVSPDHYTWAWCAYQRYNGFALTPPDVDCASYVLDEGQAADFYRFGVDKRNVVGIRWFCMPSTASWDRDRKVLRAFAAAERTWAQTIMRVKWPPVVQPAATRLANRTLDEFTWLTHMWRSDTEAGAVLSGAANKWYDAQDRTSEAAFAVRSLLGLKAPPKFTEKDCKGS